MKVKFKKECGKELEFSEIKPIKKENEDIPF